MNVNAQRSHENMHALTSFASRSAAVFVVGAAMAFSAGASPPDDACSLLTPAQVSAALGVEVGPGTYVTPTFRKTCTWSSTASGGGTVTLNLQSLEMYEGGKKLAAMGTSVSTTSVSGLGDDAYYLVSSKLVGLIVKKGTVAFKVAVYARVPVERQEAVEKTLALQVVSKL
jgi:hypothetical protein